jgi:ribosomal-protein-alanine N-acetyltransferase
MNDPGMEIGVRPMSAADVDSAVELALSLPQAPQWPRPAYLAAIDPAALVRRVALVAEKTEIGAIIGFVLASVVSPTAELESIAVSPMFQRRSVARRLFDALVVELKQVGATEVNLEVRASNQAAIALYRTLGFLEAGRRPGYYADPKEDALLFSLAIR